MNFSFLGLGFRLRTAVLLLSPSLASLLLGGCGDLFGSRKSAAAVTADGGACLRDAPETLLAALDQSCSLSSQCPHGAFCDLEIGGRCNFQCFGDSECASGKTCDCSGRCVASGGGDGGVPPEDPSCPKNTNLILQVAIPSYALSGSSEGVRTCQFDDQCPYGSSCDPAIGRCEWECLSTFDCEELGHPGTVCDCRGKCVPPGAPPAPPAPRPATLPSVTLNPPLINLPSPAGAIPVKPVFPPQTVQIRIDSPTGSVSPTGVVTGPNVVLDLRGERFVEPVCGGVNRWCQLSSFAWTKEGDRFIGTQTIQVRPSADQPAADEVSAGIWRVELHSNAIAAPVTLGIKYSDLPEATASSTWPTVSTKVDGLGYRGVVNLTIRDEPANANPDGQPRETTLAIPVLALTSGTTSMNLYDPSRVLSPSGILTFDWNAITYAEDVISGSQATTGIIRARVSHLDSAKRVQEDPVAKALTGTLSARMILRSPFSGLNAGIDQTLRFNLSPDAGVKACSAAASAPNACPAGLTCNSGFCTTGPDKVAVVAASPALSDPSMMTHPALESWASNDRIAFMRSALAPAQHIHAEFSICAVDAGTFGTSRFLSLITGMEKFSGDQFCFMPNAADSTKAQMAVPLPFLQYLRTTPRLVVGPPPPTPPPAIAPGTWPASEVLGACLRDLGATVPPLAAAMGTNPAVQLGPDYFSKDELDPTARRCLSPGNFYSSIVLALDSRRSGADSPKLYLNLMRQWLELHSFIAREGVEELKLDTVLAGANDTGGMSPNHLTYDGVLDVVERGLWLPIVEMTRAFYSPSLPSDVVFHAGISSADFASPDYRPLPQPTLAEKPVWEQPAGFAPALLEAVASYLKLMEAHLAKVDVDTYEASVGGARSPERMRALRRFGDAIRISTAVEGIASWVYGRATEGCSGGTALCNPSWQKRWREAMDIFVAQRARTFVLGSRLGLVRNPLGIGEDDVPLYFGDPTGQTGKFFASSDYLVEKWAVPAIAEARGNFDDARSAWIQKRNSTIQDELLAADRERRLEDIGRLYGRPVIDNCGLATYQGATVEAKDVLDLVNGSPLSSSNCFVDRACAVDPQTQIDATDVTQLLGALSDGGAKAAIEYKLCLTRLVLPQVAQGGTSTDLSNCLNAGPGAWNVTSNSAGKQFKCNAMSMPTAMPIPFTDLYRNRGQDSIRFKDLRQMTEACDKLYGHPAALRVPEFEASCYHGKLGEAMSRIQAATLEIAAALAHLETTEVAVVQKTQECLGMETDDMFRAKAEQDLNKLYGTWADTKNTARDHAHWWDTLHGAASGGAMLGLGGIVGGAASSWFGGAARNEEQKADDELRQAEHNYQQLVARQDRQERLNACYGELNVHKSSIDGDIATIKARAANANTARLEFKDLQQQTDQSLVEGRAARQRELLRPWGGYAFHYWHDEKVERFKRSFEWARRLTYLAMRAVEYEFQQSLPLRGAILSAQHPQQLEGAMLALEQERAGRTINRRRPEQSTVVLSLRDDVLHIVDRSGGLAASGERALSAQAVFRDRLGQGACTIYSDDGQKLGQGFHFSLDKLAAGADSGAALPNRCAERLWRVTATIQGADLSGSEPGAPAFLLKRNTFASQWCEGLGNGKTLQVAAIQPSRQLFRPDGASAPADEGQSYTAAVIFPWFNVRRTEFFKQAYTEGASEELAGRGLYGDYILLFPQELIDGGDEPDDRGFKLENVEDVLLRFDYLSVDNLPSVSN